MDKKIQTLTTNEATFRKLADLISPPKDAAPVDILGGDELNKWRALQNQQLEQAIQQKKDYAWWSFLFMLIYSAFVFILLCSSLWWWRSNDLPVAMFVALITTMPASMALFGWVLRGLFR